ncbi:MAG: hypothetical protein GQ559_10865 [Desulfobulbaceae bacterium]|nr:hypothetical protein [Desulfobulbaceae bacterium]
MPLKTFLLLISFAITTRLFSADMSAADTGDCELEAVEGYVYVKARCKWNVVNVGLLKGRRYHFSVKGHWFDASIKSGATGYTSEVEKIQGTERNNG